jgi:hypothetical protein
MSFRLLLQRQCTFECTFGHKCQHFGCRLCLLPTEGVDGSSLTAINPLRCLNHASGSCSMYKAAVSTMIRRTSMTFNRIQVQSHSSKSPVCGVHVQSPPLSFTTARSLVLSRFFCACLNLLLPTTRSCPSVYGELVTVVCLGLAVLAKGDKILAVHLLHQLLFNGDIPRGLLSFPSMFGREWKTIFTS